MLLANDNRIGSRGRLGCRPLLPVQQVAEANCELARRLGKIGEQVRWHAWSVDQLPDSTNPI
jgi:hypothetical protein